MLTDDENAFLELPASKLALSLNAKAEAKDRKRHVVVRTFSGSKKWLLATSAFLVAVVPLYELNRAAWTYVQTRRHVASMTEMADALLAVGARDRAESLLERARQLRPDDLGVLRTRALLDLERALRENQTKR